MIMLENLQSKIPTMKKRSVSKSQKTKKTNTFVMEAYRDFRNEIERYALVPES